MEYFNTVIKADKQNILITGAPGSGKTYLIESLKDFKDSIDEGNNLFRYGLLKLWDLDSFGHMTHNKEANWYIDSELTRLQYEQYVVGIAGGIIYPLTNAANIHTVYDISPEFGVWYSQLEKRMLSSEKSDKVWEKSVLDKVSPSSYLTDFVNPIESKCRSLAAKYIRSTQDETNKILIKLISALMSDYELIKM